jgi:hypothetical protein
MSLILMMIYWVLLPFLLFRAARWLYRRAGSPVGKGVVVAATGGLFSWFLWIAVGENLWLDHQVKELCAKDGGIRVYETVTLPADRFNQWGQINFARYPEGKNALGPEYVFKEDTQYYRQGNPQVSRIHYQVFRRSDGKLLGETVLYGRGGGGLPGPWYGSSFHCPDFNKDGDVALFSRIFIPSKGVEK